jgi:hypothetical protein
MHPVLARFMDFSASRAALSRQAGGAAPDPEEATWRSVADAFPDAREVIAKAEEHEGDHPDVVQPLMLLAVHAALRSVAQDARLESPLTLARAALAREGATPSQAEELLASLLLEEAFGDDREADRFDADFVAASLGEVPALAALTQEGVAELETAWMAGGKDPVKQAVVDALLFHAWGEGPSFINGEHVDAAVAEAREALRSKKQRAEVLGALEALLGLLAERGFISPPRHERLRERVARATG